MIVGYSGGKEIKGDSSRSFGRHGFWKFGMAAGAGGGTVHVNV